MDDARDLLAERLGAQPLHRIQSGGYTLMEHWLVDLADGTRAFAKVAIDEPTAGFLRDEERVYSQIKGSFAPTFLGWDDDGERPILLLEDLSEGQWPPPWREGDIAAVLAALDELHEAVPPSGLEPLTLDELHSWREVEADPEPFLSLRLCSREWLEETLPELLAASLHCEVEGDRLLHLDVRSDNLCFVDSRAILVDWNLACVGNGSFDVAFWLPSLQLEGGPQPHDVLPDAGALAAPVAGFFAARAGLPPPEGAPTVREFQRRQAEVALPWAARELDLPPPS